MDPRRLLTFREVAHQGSFSRAGEALALTQPAVSQQVAALERQLGVQLLERGPGGPTPTEAGALLLAHADAVADRLVAGRRAGRRAGRDRARDAARRRVPERARDRDPGGDRARCARSMPERPGRGGRGVGRRARRDGRRRARCTRRCASRTPSCRRAGPRAPSGTSSAREAMLAVMARGPPARRRASGCELADLADETLDGSVARRTCSTGRASRRASSRGSRSSRATCWRRAGSSHRAWR